MNELMKRRTASFSRSRGGETLMDEWMNELMKRRTASFIRSRGGETLMDE